MMAIVLSVNLMMLTMVLTDDGSDDGDVRNGDLVVMTTTVMMVMIKMQGNVIN